MKQFLKFIVGLSLLGVLAGHAQTLTATNPITGTVSSNAPATFGQAWDIFGKALASSTNWVAGGGAGRFTTGNRNIAFGFVAYDFSDFVGALVGYDNLWSPHSKVASSANILRGGVQLQLPMHPLAFTGVPALTNLTGTPYVADCLATPTKGTSNTGGVGNILVTGIDVSLLPVKNLELRAGGGYENRTGQDPYNGNAWLVHLE